MRTKNHDHMMYASWDMEHERQIFLSFWTIFFPFTTLTLRKSKFWKNEKKAPGDIIVLHLCTTNGNHMMYGSWDTERDRQNCFVILGHFWLFTPVTTQKIKICKIWKNVWRYHHITQVHQKLWSHATLFLRYVAWRM